MAFDHVAGASDIRRTSAVGEYLYSGEVASGLVSFVRPKEDSKIGTAELTVDAKGSLKVNPVLAFNVSSRPAGS